MVDDSRYRTKVYLDTYLSSAAITKNDDTTLASYITAYSDPQYPLKMVLFEPKNVDAIFSIEPPDTQPLIAWDKKAYAYHEQVPITIYTVDKTGINGLKLENKCAQELRRIFEAYPTGSVRFVKRIHHDIKDMGGWNLYTATYLADYTRVQENYTPTYPTYSWGSDWIYDGDRLTGGVEGTWDVTNHKGGSTVAYSIGSYGLDINCTAYVGDSYTHNETALAKLTATYPYIRFRYCTTGSATAKITVTGNTGTQTVLSETSNTSWTVGTATLAAGTVGTTINTINLYNCDATGHVYYDFIQLYKGDFIFPNVMEMDWENSTNNPTIDYPGMGGQLTQFLGNKLLDVNMKCDLDHEPSALTWKRPQTTTPKSDYNNSDIFLENINADSLSTWEWLDLGDPTIQMKATLERPHVYSLGGKRTIELLFHEYRSRSAFDIETYIERYNLST